METAIGARAAKRGVVVKEKVVGETETETEIETRIETGIAAGIAAGTATVERVSGAGAAKREVAAIATVVEMATGTGAETVIETGTVTGTETETGIETETEIGTAIEHDPRRGSRRAVSAARSGRSETSYWGSSSGW